MTQPIRIQLSLKCDKLSYDHPKDAGELTVSSNTSVEAHDGATEFYYLYARLIYQAESLGWLVCEECTLCPECSGI